MLPTPKAATATTGPMAEPMTSKSMRTPSRPDSVCSWGETVVRNALCSGPCSREAIARVIRGTSAMPTPAGSGAIRQYASVSGVTDSSTGAASGASRSAPCQYG